MVPSELGSTPTEEEISCGPAHISCHPSDTQQQHRACQCPLAATRIYPRREWAVCPTPEIPTGIEQPSAVPWRESQGGCQEQPQVTDRNVVFL